jgi:hypothetical protein
MVGRFRRFFDLGTYQWGNNRRRELEYTYLSHASWEHAYGRAISSSTFRLCATLRERASRDKASSTSSGGRGPLRVGIKPVSACSTPALLMFFEGDSRTRSRLLYSFVCGASPACPYRRGRSRCHVGLFIMTSASR